MTREQWLCWFPFPQWTHKLHHARQLHMHASGWHDLPFIVTITNHYDLEKPHFHLTNNHFKATFQLSFPSEHPERLSPCGWFSVPQAAARLLWLSLSVRTQGLWEASSTASDGGALLCKHQRFQEIAGSPAISSELLLNCQSFRSCLGFTSKERRIVK